MTPLSVTVRVPGSTSNLGSGFDTLGLALRLYHRVKATRTAGQRITVRVLQPEAVRRKATQLVTEAAGLFFSRYRRRAFGLEVTLGGNLPIGRGLGASGATRIGLLLALNRLANTGLSRQELLDLATELEGHPDNASPALFGGFTVSGMVQGSVRCLRFPVNSRLRFVTLIPFFQIDTKQARRLVPAHFSKTDAAHGLNRAALLAAALSSGKYSALRGLFDDRIHQPYREQLIPQLRKVISAGEKAGAIGGWLSGSGSAIICLTVDRASEVAEAMHSQLPLATIHLLAADNQGATVSVNRFEG